MGADTGRTATEAGRRRERTEWGLRALIAVPEIHRKGHVEAYGEDEAWARRVMGASNARSLARCGEREYELVQRTVVTHTTNWATAPTDPTS